MCQRHNHVFAAYVDAAITIQTKLGLKRAEDFLRKEGIPSTVIVRVLFARAPVRRRASLSSTSSQFMGVLG